MDVNTLRIVVTVAAFAAFVGILVWAFLPSRKSDFDEAVRLPFQSE